MHPYVKQYKWSNIFTMIRNSRADPEICLDDFSNKLVVITGATSGIGYETAKKFASHGASLLFLNRNKDKSDELCEQLRKDFGTICDYKLADFSSLVDTHEAAKRLVNLDRPIDVLIHNAGLYLSKRTLTEDKLETVFQTNYLSSFILNFSLREKFRNQKQGRIIFVNSEAYRFCVWGLDLTDLSWEKNRYSGIKSYGAAKLAQLLSMIKFSEYFAGSGVTINAMHPGNVTTNSGQSNDESYKFLKRIIVDSNARPINIAAESLYYLGVSEKMNNISGKFFNLTTEEAPAPPVLDRSASEKLWEISLELGGLNEQ